MMIATLVLMAAALPAVAQPPDDDSAPAPRPAAGNVVVRMMRFDKNKDGKLTKSELTDARFRRLFDRADTDKDGFVTKAELAAIANQFQEREAEGPRGFGPPDGFPPPPGGGPGRGMGPPSPPRPGELLPTMLRRNLKLTAAQTKELDDLQKEVDAKIDKILTDSQKKQLKEMRQRGPRMFGGPGGPPPGGPDGPPPGGPPPDGPGGPPPGGPDGGPPPDGPGGGGPPPDGQ
jgi:hypothetical protein